MNLIRVRATDMLAPYRHRLNKMAKVLIVANFLFLICNAVWFFVTNDYRMYYVPLALLLVAFNFYVYKTWKGSKVILVFFDYFLWLSYGNLIKMVFLNNKTVSEINDYVFGVVLTIVLIYRLWVIRKQRSGTK